MHKEITIYDLAKELDLSPATVSRGLKNNPAINLHTRKRIVEKARQMGYRSNLSASHLRTKKTHTIGVIVPRLNSNFLATVLSAMEKIASQSGYNIIISQSMESMQKEIVNAQTMLENRVDGLLVSLAFDTTENEHFKPFLQRETPLIFFDRVVELPGCLNIVIDNYQMAFDLTRHLIEQGCRQLMHITGNLNRSVYAERYRGFRDALKKSRLKFSKESLLTGDLNELSGLEAADLLMRRKELPDGIFVTNDSCAASCMRTLQQMGIRVPQDIAIAGFNNDFIARITTPAITSIHYPAYEMGETAMQCLLDHLQGKKKIRSGKIVLPSELIIRDSTLKLQYK